MTEIAVLPHPDGEALQTEEIGFAALGELSAASGRVERADILARAILAVFDDYFGRFTRIAPLAKAAFEARDWPATIRLSAERLSLYSVAVATFAPILHAGSPELGRDEGFWDLVEARYVSLIEPRYEADLAFAFLASVRRKVVQDEWRPVTYGYHAARTGAIEPPPDMLARIETELPVDASVARDILRLPGFSVPWRDLQEDAALVAAEIGKAAERFGPLSGPVRIEMVKSGFFRNRGAYLVGRIAAGDAACPLLIAVLNGPSGLFVDAVLTDSDELQYAFSTTLANFHVTSPHYHALAAFLHRLMPKRPIGIHYSTIGFNHLGKIEVMNEILGEHSSAGELLGAAVGFRGTVAIGFSMPSSSYVLKIIRDHPTAGYKWGDFPGIERVLDKYRLVHESDRAGSMLDNIIYYRVKLERSMFTRELLDELLSAGGSTVSLLGRHVIFRHLIVQMKMIPLPVYLEAASPEEARLAVLNLGDCIKNNAAANIFNKDLDGRNYGVSPIGKVYLFDYDAVEPLTGIKVRTNTDREEGEEGIPDWYFEEGTVFLPEEMLPGLRIDDPELRRIFRQAHPDLLTVDYWEGMQRALAAGKVPRVRSYPEARRLRRHLAAA
ncbi:bifunctional isocitrate dehydrogenase kinase/phosphatase [Faunimonas sp. B44]|uniref:bifunctional isocitrate dehydrogenase kinase/phosphatase n=1 Tax=Faunimonas sp. B44 TaxID=3461493 RepID=UPI004044AA30